MKNIFISHSSKNEIYIRRLKKFFPNKDYITWVSFENIQPAKDISDKIKKKLSECDFVIFILTKEALRSPYVNQEIGYALGLGKEIIPVIEYKKSQLKGFLAGKDALKLYIDDPKKTFLEILPFLKNDEMYKRPSSSKNKFALTIVGHEMWLKILSEMEKGPTPISSFMGSFGSYKNRIELDKRMIINRFNYFNNFFVAKNIVESVKLETMKRHVYSFGDLKEWETLLNKPVLYKLTDIGKEMLEIWKKVKITDGDTIVLSYEIDEASRFKREAVKAIHTEGLFSQYKGHYESLKDEEIAFYAQKGERKYFIIIYYAEPTKKPLSKTKLQRYFDEALNSSCIYIIVTNYVSSEVTYMLNELNRGLKEHKMHIIVGSSEIEFVEKIKNVL